MAGKLIDIRLFGSCSVTSTEPGRFAITGAKHKALFALLVTAPFGKRTRAYLQETLWGQACYDTGRQSLRRALSDIKALMGPNYEALFSSTNSELTIDLSKVQFSGAPGVGLFLEGIDIKEAGFNRWLRGIRDNSGQLAALYGLTSRPLNHALLPVIAVLPFRAVGAEPNDAVLGDWLAEEICRSLSRSRLLAVISHLSCRELAKGIIHIATVREALNVDFCVSGTVRRAAGQLVLDADLVDTRSGQILWTRQFAASEQHFLGRAGDGIAQIVGAVGGAIADDALEHIRGMAPVKIDDHRLMITAVSLMHRSTLRDFARSRELLDEALHRAPTSAEVYAWLGKWYVLSVFNGWSTDTGKETRQALDCTARALDLSPDNAFCLTIDGFAHNNLLRRLDVAEKRYDAALAANPNAALSWLLKGALHAFCDEGAQAVAATDRARQLSPLDPFAYFYDTLSATAYLAHNDHERALAFADRSLLANDRHLSTLRTKIVALHGLGREGEARETAQELLRRQPDFTVEDYERLHPAAQHAIGRTAATALRAAGIP